MTAVRDAAENGVTELTEAHTHSLAPTVSGSLSLRFDRLRKFKFEAAVHIRENS